MAKGNYKVPFAPGQGMYGNYPLVDNFVFADVLGINFISPTRSSCIVSLESIITGKKYRMFVTEFNDILANKKFKNGCISGSFTFVKRGHSYGIRLITAEEKSTIS